MSGIRVRCEVREYTEGVDWREQGTIVVESDHFHNDRVRLTVGDKTVTVIAAHMIEAVQNATRVGR